MVQSFKDLNFGAHDTIEQLLDALNSYLGTLPNLQTNAKTDLVSAINEHSSLLAENALLVSEILNIDNFTGANDTTKFYNACANAISNGKIIKLTRNITLDASVYNQFAIPSIDGNGFTLTVNNALHLYVGSACLFIKNLNIIDTNNYAMSDFTGTNKSQYDKGYLFETLSGFTINGIIVQNVTFTGTSATSTGTYRTKGVFYFKGNNITFRDIIISDARAGFYINDPVSHTVTNYDVTFENIKFYNQEQGIWINSTARIYLNDISLINTSTQQSNYSCLQGSDLYNFLYSNDIEIYKTYSNYVIERPVYFNTTNNVVFDGITVDNAGGGNGGGIKFYGLLNAGTYSYPCTNVKVKNAIFSGNGRSYAFELYNTVDVEISGVVVNPSSGTFDFFVGMNNNNKNTYIHHCDIYGLTTNFIYGVLSPQDSLNGNSNNTHFYNGLNVEDCRIIDPVTGSSLRSLIYLSNPNSKTLTDRTFFTFDNFTFKNNTVIQRPPYTTWTASTAYVAGNIVTPTTSNGCFYKCTTAGTSGSSQPTWPVTFGSTITDGTVVWSCIDPFVVNPIDTTTRLTFLLDGTFPVNHVLYENNRIRGCNQTTGFMSIHPSSTDVVVKGDYFINTSNCVPYSPVLYCSYPSDIRFLASDTTGLYEARARYNNAQVPATTWAASTAYSVGNIVVPTTSNGYVYRCTTAGTSGTSQPTFPTNIGSTVTDGTVVWTCQDPKLSLSILNNVADVVLQYSPSASEIKIFYQTNNGTRLYSGYGEIFFADGTYCRFNVTNSSGTLTMSIINGSGTLSGNQINFSNGSDLEFGPTYKELRVRSGSTPVGYTVKWNATV